MCRSLIAILTIVLATACSHTPPITQPGEFCEIKRYSLEATLPGETDMTEFSAVTAQVMSDGSGSMLFLSGGSENGAFGAGFLQGWKNREGGLPDFKLVTGVSTGALISTGAFINRPEIAVDGYRISQESDLLKVFSKPNGSDELGLSQVRTILRRGSLADLVPLRARLRGVLSDDVFEAVAMKAKKGHRLFVGATDVDAGQAVAFDMTELAVRYVDAAGDQPRMERIKNCYVEALVASSVVPGAALPVFIDNRMYVDGGVKYAVFAEDLGDQIEPMLTRRSITVDTDLQVYIILNGDGASLAQCGKTDEANCPPNASPFALEGAHEDWDILSLASRTVSLLTNQVQRLSIERAAELNREFETNVFFARIRAEELASEEYEIDLEEGLRSCTGWKQLDDELDSPLEFHPRFMHCLTHYGIDRGEALSWDSTN